jgi:hypothetical protein
MAADKSEKCAHVACLCAPARGEKYCSQPCKEAGSEEEVGGLRRRLTWKLFGFGRSNVRFNGDVDVSTRPEGHRLAIFILQSILDAYLSVEVIRALNRDLCLLGITGVRGRDDLFNSSGEGHRWLLVVRLAILRLHSQTAPFLTERPGCFALPSPIDSCSKISNFTATPSNVEAQGGATTVWRRTNDAPFQLPYRILHRARVLRDLESSQPAGRYRTFCDAPAYMSDKRKK